jgi:hypothetical protein
MLTIFLGFILIIAEESVEPSCVGTDDTALTAIQANLSVIKDVQFVYEGGYRLLNAENNPTIFKNPAPDEDYQGTYAYRFSDGCTYLDTYHFIRIASAPMRRKTQALLKSKLEILDQIPDLARKLTPVDRRNGGPGSFNSMASPEPFLSFWIYRKILLDPLTYHYEDVGSEQVDGHACRKVQVNEFARYELPERRLVFYWVDLERGGLPLKIEYTRNGKVRRRTHDIKLQSFKTDDGHQVWMPISGVTDFFVEEGGDFAGATYIRDNCSVVPTSVRINQGLEDSFFSVRREPTESSSEVIRKAEDRFNEASAGKQATRDMPTDPKRVQERLASNLAEADRQSQEIKASSVAREADRQPSLLTITLAIAGVLALIVITYIWIRRR